MLYKFGDNNDNTRKMLYNLIFIYQIKIIKNNDNELNVRRFQFKC